jgi:two-component system, response regulator PdtaR
LKNRLVILAAPIERDESTGSDSKRSVSGQGDRVGKEKNITELKTVRRTKRIIVVDDDHGIRNMLQNILKIKGFEVSASFSDGAELVELIDEVDPKPDVILLDERMPRMSGTEASQIIHERYPSISIVFVSADETAKERAKQTGAVAFLKKPVSVADLISLINSV